MILGIFFPQHSLGLIIKYHNFSINLRVFFIYVICIFLSFQVFRPAEFRWTLDEVSDDRWHHYAVSVDEDDEAGDGGVSHVCSESCV